MNALLQLLDLNFILKLEKYTVPSHGISSLNVIVRRDGLEDHGFEIVWPVNERRLQQTVDQLLDHLEADHGISRKPRQAQVGDPVFVQGLGWGRIIANEKAGATLEIVLDGGPPVPMPAPDRDGWYQFPDGSGVRPLAYENKTEWFACFADGSRVVDVNGNTALFPSAIAAAMKLAECDEGPASMPVEGADHAV